MYDQFARFYDRESLNDFTPVILDFIQARRFTVRRVLDLGCGTGTFLLKLAGQGIAGTGIDLSENMIALARKKAEQSPGRELIDFHVADMAGFSLDRRYDLVTSNLDSINHLPGEDEVRRTFSRAYEHLADGGLFYFDVHTVAGLRTWSFRENVQEEDYFSFSRAFFDEETRRGTLVIDAFRKVDPRVPYYARYRETIREKAYPLAQIFDWLKAARFSTVETIGPSSNLSVEEMEKLIRCFICAYK